MAAKKTAKKPVSATVAAAGAALAALKNRTVSQPTSTIARHIGVKALAGTGKTTTIVQGIRNTLGLSSKLKPSAEQSAIWEVMAEGERPNTIRVAAFNKSIALEIAGRLEDVPQCEVKTMHAFGLSILKRDSQKRFPQSMKISQWRLTNILEKLTSKDSRQLRKDGYPINAIEQMVKLCKINLIDWHAPDFEDRFNMLASYYDVEINGSRTVILEMVPRVLDACMTPDDGKHGPYFKEIDYDDMVWLPYALNLEIPPADWCIIDEAQDLNRAQQALVSKLGRRQIYVGDEHQCQPAGTLVSMADGSFKPIEEIQKGDSVISWDRRSSALIKNCKVTKVASRKYYRKLTSIITESGLSTEATDSHKWTVRWVCKDVDYWCVYLMRRVVDGREDYRIGWCQMFTSGGCFHLAQRTRLEEADSAWILSIHDSKQSASKQESLIAASYGLPLVQFKANDSATEIYTQPMLDSHWKSVHKMANKVDNIGESRLDSFTGETEYVDVHRNRAIQVLEDHDLCIEYPLYATSDRKRQGRTTIFETQSCNLIPGFMAVPTPNFKSKTVNWELIVRTRLISGSCRVYSLNIDKYHKYISDGIVTCNSIYGFAGADVDSFSNVINRLNKTPEGVIVLPLTETRRCGRAIVEEAAKIVPEFKAHASNPAGEIGRLSAEKFMESVAPTDMVVCRINAPLVSVCFRLLKDGRKARIQGRDIGEGLIRLVKKLGASDISDFVVKLTEWHAKEEEKLLKSKFRSESQVIALQDKMDCLIVFAEGVESINDLIALIDQMFDDSELGDFVRLSSIHRAKGLEASTVYILNPELLPHPMAKTAWQIEQEKNLKYVSYTRAIHRLILVETAPKK